MLKFKVLTLILKVTAYLLLLAGGIVFVIRSINEYLEYKTNLTVTKEPLTLSDIPTIVLCHDHLIPQVGDLSSAWGMERKYGKDFMFEASTRAGSISSGTVILSDEKSTTIVSNFNLTRSRLHANNERLCHKITPQWSLNTEIEARVSNLQLRLRFVNVTPPTSAQVTFTSEENSYGRIFDRWYDGGSVKVLSLNDGQGYSAKIVSVKEYFYLKPNCSQDSYFECLAKRFATLGKDIKRKLTGDNEYCKLDNVCTPFSLPSIGNHNIPICKGHSDIHCNSKVLQNLRLDQSRYCERSCHVKEYILDRDSKLGHNDTINGFSFTLTFDTPKSTKGRRSDEPIKKVYREYYVLTEMTLLGNMGGHLGMFVGFSFITCFDWLIEFTSKVWARASVKAT